MNVSQPCFAAGKEHVELLTSKKAPSVVKVTDSGIIEDTASYLEPSSVIHQQLCRESDFMQSTADGASVMEGSVVDSDYADRLAMKAAANGSTAKPATDMWYDAEWSNKK